jgi:response regulator RpfG family c-di-GMP phosphodiesterase
MENLQKSTLEMHTLLLCNDTAFVGITRNILHQLDVTPKMINTSAAAVATIQANQFDGIVVDWREIESLPEFFSAVRRSKLNQDSVLVAIVRDLLDLRQAFAAGVHFLIHKPASATQIERRLLCHGRAPPQTPSRTRCHSGLSQHAHSTHGRGDDRECE